MWGLEKDIEELRVELAIEWQCLAIEFQRCFRRVSVLFSLDTSLRLQGLWEGRLKGNC